MTKLSPFILALTAALAFGASASSALAQGYGYGSAGGVAATLGVTASPPIAQRRMPAGAPIFAEPAEQPATTGSVARGNRAWTRAHRH